MERDAAIDALYAAPLEAFVAERKRVAREVREAGDREAAAEIAKWPKPSPAAWALNRLVRDEHPAAQAWLGATDVLREAFGGGGGDPRAAMAEQRDATVAAVEAARAEHGLSAAMLERVRGLLQTATGDEGLMDALRAGRVDEPDGDAPAAAAEAAPTARPGPAKRRSGPAAAKRKDASTKRERQAAERAEREAAAAREHERRVDVAAGEVARLRTTAGDRADEATAAATRVEEVEEALAVAREASRAAKAAAKDAAKAHARAERELEKLRGGGRA